MCRNLQLLHDTTIDCNPAFRVNNRARPAISPSLALHNPQYSHQWPTASAYLTINHCPVSTCTFATYRPCSRTLLRALIFSTRGGTGSGALPLYGSKCETGTGSYLPVRGCSMVAASLEATRYLRKRYGPVAGRCSPPALRYHSSTRSPSLYSSSSTSYIVAS